MPYTIETMTREWAVEISQWQSARIPTGDCYHYLDDKLDIGLGMRLTVERTVTHKISGASFGEDFWDC